MLYTQWNNLACPIFTYDDLYSLPLHPVVPCLTLLPPVLPHEPMTTCHASMLITKKAAPTFCTTAMSLSTALQNMSCTIELASMPHASMSSATLVLHFNASHVWDQSYPIHSKSSVRCCLTTDCMVHSTCITMTSASPSHPVCTSSTPPTQLTPVRVPCPHHQPVHATILVYLFSVLLSWQSILNLTHNLNRIPDNVLIEFLIKGLTDEVEPLMDWESPMAMVHSSC